jgi:hypothetical protein
MQLRAARRGGVWHEYVEISAQLIARHWFTHHAMKEMGCIEKKSLDMSQARIINSPARMSVAMKYIARRPFVFCGNATDPHRYFVRQDTLVRHMETCAKKENARRAKDDKILSDESILLLSAWANRMQYDRSPFGSEYEAAVWSVHNA